MAQLRSTSIVQRLVLAPQANSVQALRPARNNGRAVQAPWAWAGAAQRKRGVTSPTVGPYLLADTSSTSSSKR